MISDEERTREQERGRGRRGEGGKTISDGVSKFLSIANEII